MSVTKKHTSERVTDNLLEADKSPEDSRDNAEQRLAPYKGSWAPTYTDTGETLPGGRRAGFQGRGRSGRCGSGREDDTFSQGWCQWRITG